MPVTEERDLRIIKKYPNRRLYDTVQSRYVTLPEVRDLVISVFDDHELLRVLWRERVVGDQWYVTSSPTGINRDSLRWAGEAFADVLPRLRTLVFDRVRPLEEKLEAAGVEVIQGCSIVAVGHSPAEFPE